MRIKCCPRKSCQSKRVKVVWENIEDFTGRLHRKARVLCEQCGQLGVYGNVAGHASEYAAVAYWNEEWGRSE